MSFANPAVLWALPLVLAPILLHLLSRRRAQRVRFSDLVLLRRVHAESLPRTRLRKWLLTAVRCAIVGALVCAYAGPVLEARGRGVAAAGADAGEGLDLALLLDSSVSMGAVDRGRTRWAAARSAAEDMLRSLRPGDRVACAVFSDRIENNEGKLSWMTARECQELFSRSQPGWRGTDYGPALRGAYELLAASRRQRAVLLLSDGAAHGLRSALPPAEPGIALYGLAWPKPPFNSAVSAAGPARDSSAQKPSLRTVLWASAAGSSAVDLWQDRARLAGEPVALRAGDISLSLPLPRYSGPDAAGWSGRVELRPDALAADDVFFYSFRHPRRPRLLVLYGNPAFLKAPNSGYFLKELFSGAKGRALDWDAEFAGMDLLASGGSDSSGNALRLADYDAAVLADFQSLPPAVASAVEPFVRRGGGLWILPGSRTPPDAAAPLGPWLGVRLGEMSGSGARGLQVEKSTGSFQVWRDFELDKVALAGFLRLEPQAGAKTWLRTGAGEPLLVTAEHGAGRVAVWAAPLDAVSGNLPVKPVYAALVASIVSLVRPPEGQVENLALRVGDPITRVWGSREAAPARVRVRSPEGRTTALWVRDRRVEYSLTSRPGLYAMDDDVGDSRVYGVNFDRGSGESDLSAVASPPWIAIDSERAREDFWLKVRGRDLRAAVMAAAVAFLVAEMLLCLPMSLAVVAILASILWPVPATAETQRSDRFVWTQLKLGPGWDPYPTAPGEIDGLLASVTSVLVEPQRRVITLKDPDIFASPLLILAGREAPAPLDAEEVKRLRGYLSAGGMLWLEDTSGSAASSFDRWVRSTLKDLLPEAELRALESDHVVFKTFFLLRGAAGRVMVRGTLEGVSWGGRAAVVYSRNDLLGAWVKDPLGRPLLPCLPGGEAQRHNARKLTLNIIMYSLTGSYKSDAVHQPYLLQKMRSGIP
ncbi:MAG TPA: hypothetical protein DCP85_03350 [Elusimicrobia bacterium]|nr:hypothetical protein [Elusimicrobiota bacterium]